LNHEPANPDLTKDIIPLQSVLDRVGYADPREGAFFFWDEVQDWPPHEFKALISSGLLKPASPASTIECDGCEERCLMPVVVYPSLEGNPGRTFISCDKRDDIGRILVSSNRMKRWRSSIDAVRKFIATNLGLRISNEQMGDDLWTIGMARAKKRQMLCLQSSGELILVAGNNRIPLMELITYGNGSYSLDEEMISQLVDASTTADKRYTPTETRREARKRETEARHESWQKAYRDLKKKIPDQPDTWYAQRISKMTIASGCVAETIRKQMKT
jgi:hypothetical protein